MNSLALNIARQNAGKPSSLIKASAARSSPASGARPNASQNAPDLSSAIARRFPFEPSAEQFGLLHHEW